MDFPTILAILMTNSSVEQQDKVCLNSFLCYDLVCKMQIGWGKLHSSFPLITFQVIGLLCFKNQQEARTKTQICESEFEQDKLGQSGSVLLFFRGGADLPPAVFPARSLQTFQWCMDVFKPFVIWIGHQSQSWCPLKLKARVHVHSCLFLVSLSMGLPSFS